MIPTLDKPPACAEGRQGTKICHEATRHENLRFEI